MFFVLSVLVLVCALWVLVYAVRVERSRTAQLRMERGKVAVVRATLDLVRSDRDSVRSERNFWLSQGRSASEELTMLEADYGALVISHTALLAALDTEKENHDADLSRDRDKIIRLQRALDLRTLRPQPS